MLVWGGGSILQLESLRLSGPIAHTQFKSFSILHKGLIFRKLSISHKHQSNGFVQPTVIPQIHTQEKRT